MNAVKDRDAEPLMRTEGLRKDFGGLRAVDDLTFAVLPGRVHAVIGPNGAGKTTLFNLATGQLRPSAGRIYFRGEDVTGLRPHQITQRGISRKFQITQVFGEMSVMDNVMLALHRHYRRRTLALRTPREARERANEILTLMRLTAKDDIRAAALAHGESQRLELGMVLATGASLLLLDEPTSGMSLEEREEMAGLLRLMASETTIVITEHDFNFIKRVADVVTVLNKGAKLAEGDVATIERDEAVRECYLGPVDADG
jgi:branched-chain amino acid transport system ATP-binding protein